MQNWNMKYVDISRSPESALRVIHQQLTTGKSHEDREIGEVGTFVQRTEMDAPRIGKLVKKSEMGDPRVGKLMRKIEVNGLQAKNLVKKIKMNESKV